jgi:redox-sensing transcriptional repressor
LLGLKLKDPASIFSHQLATMTGFTSVQIRRDLMSIGYFGSPARGYELDKLLASLNDFIDAPGGQGVALIGLGHLGRAVLDYVQGRRPNLNIVLAFDTDPQKVNRVVQGCPCYHTDELEKRIVENAIKVGIIAVPMMEGQEIAERLVASGVRGILNYAPVNLKLPPEVFVENRDMILALEKAAYFSRQISN